MSLPSWLDVFRSRTESRRSRRSRRSADSRRREQRRLLVEGLEDRRLLTFVPAVDYPVGTSPQAVVAADFNNDSIQDLAVANYSDSTVSVLLGKADTLGNPDGTFQPALTSGTGDNPLSLAVGDFNDDGIFDLATANSGSSDVSVLLGIEGAPGKGTGNFEAPTNIGIGSAPQSVAVGDFNGDGLLDLGVTSNLYVYDGSYCYWSCYPYYHYESYANVLLGNADIDGKADGTFSAPHSTFLDFTSHNSALAADLNGDIYDDFVTFHSYGYVTVLLGHSSGTLQGPTSFYTGDYSYAVAADDLDGDGDNDLVTANYYGNSVGVLLGNGAGSFSSPTNYGVGGYPTSIVLGDFTGDGDLDVATANYSSNQVAVLYGGGDGAFSTPVLSAVGSPWAIAAGDFNGDSWLDAATANSGSGSVSVLINDQLWPSPPPPPPPSVSINNPTAVLEGNTDSVDVTFTLTLSFAYATPITVHYETADGSATAGSDYTDTSGDVTFAPFQTTYDITVAVLGDRLAESTETFVVNLTTTDAFIGDDEGVGTVLDDEPRISINDVSKREGNGKGTTQYLFTVTLSAAYDEAVTVNFATADVFSAAAGSDYQARNGTLTFAPGVTSMTIPINVIREKVKEANETFSVNLSGASSNALISDDQGIGTIGNDDKGTGKPGSSSSASLIAALLASDDTLTTTRKRK